jgi:hypothetical protein
MSKRTFTDYEIDNWNWNFSITTQNQHEHAIELIGSISESVEKINHSETRITLLIALIETSKRLIEREKNSI